MASKNARKYQSIHHRSDKIPYNYRGARQSIAVAAVESFHPRRDKSVRGMIVQTLGSVRYKKTLGAPNWSQDMEGCFKEECTKGLIEV